MLIFLDAEDKLNNADEVDKYLWSEIPDKVNNPRLYEIVKKFMIHGHCGERNLNSPCMDEKKEKCTKNFPKPFNDSTMYNTTGYPLYRRRNDANKWADNRFVVPYNPYLLLLFNYHVNVEVCSTILSIKYLFKYCYKSHDCALIEMKTYSKITEGENVDTNDIIDNVELEYDEIKQYINTRYVCPSEAMHRL